MTKSSFFTVTLLACGAIASGCATATYKPPLTSAPKLWQGNSGVAPADKAWEVVPGRHAVNSSFASVALENRRTAILQEPVTFRDVGDMGYTNKEKVLPAGTALYARQYTHSVTTRTSYGSATTRTQSALLNPIEWCAEGEVNGAGIPEGWTCMFWQSPDSAYYVSQSKGHAQFPKIDGSGSLGPMPSILETDEVTFTSKMTANIVIRSLSKKDASIYLIMGHEANGEWDGKGSEYQRKYWDENDTVKFFAAGGEYVLKAVRDSPGETPKFVDVEIIVPPKVQTAGLSVEEQKLLLELLMKAKGTEAQP